MKDNTTNEKLFGSDQSYQRMVAEVEDYAILMMDASGNIKNWNKGAEKIKGYTEKDILGRNFNIFYLPEDRQQGLPQQLITIAKNEGRATHEGWRVRKDGTTFWGYVVITALHDDDGSIIGFTKVTRDLTERKLAEDQKEQDAKSIASQNRQLEEFAYITSHDLQEPVRKIQTYIGLIKKDINNKENLVRYLDKIDDSSERIVNLIKDVLNFSRLSFTQDNFVAVNLNTTLKEVLDDFEIAIKEKDATIILGALPNVIGIPIQFQQLFSNLISNALKFNNGNPKITIAAEHLPEDGSYKITIEDDGIGFDTQYADQAFQPFKRLTSDYPGTGIGLALCKRIVENHRGAIKVESNIGEGTKFTLLLPEV